MPDIRSVNQNHPGLRVVRAVRAVRERRGERDGERKVSGQKREEIGREEIGRRGREGEIHEWKNGRGYKRIDSESKRDAN